MTYGIVIASYKYGHLAAHCIETVLEQTKKFDKIWFVDDGVGDCKHLQNIYPEVQYVLRETNRGTVANFADMLNRVDTDRVMFLGADNWLRADTLDVLSKESCDIVTYDIMVVGEHRKWVQKHFQKATTETKEGVYWDRACGHHGSMMYNVTKAKEIGYHSNPGKTTTEDLFLYNGMLNKGATRSHVPEALLYYRRHRENFNPVT